ncbi:hypothetical protein [Streptococcus suis]|uniref:hypothetical protein n=1 Tax=Streptococcus suis TaxID=1307 RepID=UPI003756AB5A
MKKKLLRLGFVALSVLVLTACQVGTKEYLSVSFKGTMVMELQPYLLIGRS